MRRLCQLADGEWPVPGHDEQGPQLVTRQVDVDGNGFQPNGDDLGLPLPDIKELR